MEVSGKLHASSTVPTVKNASTYWKPDGPLGPSGPSGIRSPDCQSLSLVNTPTSLLVLLVKMKECINDSSTSTLEEAIKAQESRGIPVLFL